MPRIQQVDLESEQSTVILPEVRQFYRGIDLSAQPHRRSKKECRIDAVHPLPHQVELQQSPLTGSLSEVRLQIRLFRTVLQVKVRDYGEFRIAVIEKRRLPVHQPDLLTI